MKYKRLIEAAAKAKKYSHSPFSKFRVGAALLTRNNKIITGCNVEINSFSLTICAERTAIFKAYSEGERTFKAIAISTDAPVNTPPCGACRQVLMDLAGDIDVILANKKSMLSIYKLSELLPTAFTKNHMLT